MSNLTQQYGFSFSHVALVIGSLVFLVTSFLFALSSGNADISLAQVVEALVCSHNCSIDAVDKKIITEIRLPRTLMALITGSGLAITGAVLQSITRNPLADPYLFGISSGSALGAVIVLSIIPAAAISLTLGALAGGIFAVLLMLIIVGRAAANIERLVLAGVAVSFMLSAFTSLVLYYSRPEISATLLFWMMGSFSGSEWNQLFFPVITVLVGLTIFLIFRRWLSAIQAGDESAGTLGIPVSKLRLIMLLICSAITAVLVAHVGGIGFVGLMIPHVCRFIVGNQIHKVLIMCLVVGGSFMIWVDIVANGLLDNQVLPVGVVTSAIGSLFFFIILKLRAQRRM